jgi:hypothetical protein
VHRLIVADGLGLLVLEDLVVAEIDPSVLTGQVDALARTTEERGEEVTRVGSGKEERSGEVQRA